MVRIKFTGPAAAVQLQPASIQMPVSKSISSTQKRNQVGLEHRQNPLNLERLSLKQQQSLEMVQIMLHVSFGTLFYLREFLPLHCFDDRDLKETQRGQKLSYQGFIEKASTPNASDNNPEIAFGSGRRGQPLKIIDRGTDAKADTILDALETGIFDALHRNVLQAIQLTILVDKDTPENVLESYTFSFKYTGRAGDVGSCLESLTVDSVGCVADMKSAQTARVGLETIVRRLITLSAFLPTLPNKRNLGIHLFYTDDCPPDYEPPGFATAKTDTIRYPMNDHWRKDSQLCGTMDSGWHTVGLKVTSLKWIGPEPEETETPPRIPAHLEYTDVVERGNDIGFSNGIEALYPITNANDKAPNNLSLDRAQSPVAGHDTGHSQEGTQDMADREKLQRMIPVQRASPYPESDLVPTQPVYKHDNTEKGRLSLKEKKTAQIKERLRFQTALHDNNGLRALNPIKCQCGWNGEEADMHLLCYGFKNATDPRIPDTHACYQCLLERDEPQVLNEMNGLVLLRRALKIITEEGFPKTGSIFAQKLHCNGQTVIQITDLLKKKGFIQPTPGYKAKGATSDLHMAFSYENSSFGEPNPEKSEMVLGRYETSDLQASTDPESLGDISASRRKSLMEIEGRLSDLEEISQSSVIGENRRSSKRISDRVEHGGSDEKRRKISNYPNPIDVGADTTDNESTDV
ncbi:DNA binding protein [Aspergillus nanangensis]|uniref:DNA binding protein n=1 Tax=Aspergillus nanangensis TaxID=2582783 RepID=A0AAD4GR94_ASPNN|nr:DNA binding protein [Aspergillus nanangensis]